VTTVALWHCRPETSHIFQMQHLVIDTAYRLCRSGTGRARTATHAEVGRSVEDKYSAMYEKGLDPFSEFKGHALQSRKAHMTVADKLVFGLGKAVISNKWARLAAVAYAVLMHVITFSVLLRLSHRHHSLLVACGAHLPHRTGGVLATGLDADGGAELPR
jgi:hypothetical protein